VERPLKFLLALLAVTSVCCTTFHQRQDSKTESVLYLRRLNDDVFIKECAQGADENCGPIISTIERVVPAQLLKEHLLTAFLIQFIDPLDEAGEKTKTDIYGNAYLDIPLAVPRILQKNIGTVESFIRFFCRPFVSEETCALQYTEIDRLRYLSKAFLPAEGKRNVTYPINRSIEKLIDVKLRSGTVTRVLSNDPIAYHILRSYVRTQPILFDFVTVEPASFTMGSPREEKGRWPDEDKNRVVITKAFALQTTTVTQRQWVGVMGTNPSYFSEKKYCPETYTDFEGTDLCPSLPVESVSWNDVQSLIDKLSWQDPKYRYRLPTEAEWELAARAGSQSAYSFGESDEHLGDYAWFVENSSQQTHAVATKRANAFGLYDMNGNVWQWVQDLYAKYPTTSARRDPAGPDQPNEGPFRVIRGGNWFFNSRALRSAARFQFFPDGPGVRCRGLGARLVRETK
jgi:formylglycine-generating enzyme required for sulfatase activity